MDQIIKMVTVWRVEKNSSKKINLSAHEAGKWSIHWKLKVLFVLVWQLLKDYLFHFKTTYHS